MCRLKNKNFIVVLANDRTWYDWKIEWLNLGSPTESGQKSPRIAHDTSLVRGCEKRKVDNFSDRNPRLLPNHQTKTHYELERGRSPINFCFRNLWVTSLKLEILGWVTTSDFCRQSCPLCASHNLGPMMYRAQAEVIFAHSPWVIRGWAAWFFNHPRSNSCFAICT